MARPRGYGGAHTAGIRRFPVHRSRSATVFDLCRWPGACERRTRPIRSNWLGWPVAGAGAGPCAAAACGDSTASSCGPACTAHAGTVPGVVARASPLALPLCRPTSLRRARRCRRQHISRYTSTVFGRARGARNPPARGGRHARRGVCVPFFHGLASLSFSSEEKETEMASCFGG